MPKVSRYNAGIRIDQNSQDWALAYRKAISDDGYNSQIQDQPAASRGIELRQFPMPPSWLSRECESDENPVSPDMAAAMYERLGRLFADLMAQTGTLIFSRQDDDDFCLNFTGRNRRRCSAMRPTLVEVFEVALGREPEKVCLTCGLMKPISHFGMHRTTSDGRCGRCRKCESERICGIQRRARTKRKDKTG